MSIATICGRFAQLAAITLATTGFAHVASADYVTYKTSASPSQPTHAKNMGLQDERLCFLTRVSVENTDYTGEYARCRIKADNGAWILLAEVDPNTVDAKAECYARCFTGLIAPAP